MTSHNVDHKNLDNEKSIKKYIKNYRQFFATFSKSLTKKSSGKGFSSCINVDGVAGALGVGVTVSAANFKKTISRLDVQQMDDIKIILKAIMLFFKMFMVVFFLNYTVITI